MKKTAVAETTEHKASLEEIIQRYRPKVAQILPTIYNPERFLRIFLTTILKNEKIRACSPTSIISCLLQSAMLGLDVDPVLELACLVPYKGEAQFQIMYQGWKTLVYRTGEVSMIDSDVIYEGDEWEITRGENPTLKHIPSRQYLMGKIPLSQRIPIIAYAVIHGKTGWKQFAYLTSQEIAIIRATSKTESTLTPWRANELTLKRMWEKSAIKRACKQCPHMETVVALKRAVHIDDMHEAGKPVKQDELLDVIDNEILPANTGTSATAEIPATAGIPKPASPQKTAHQLSKTIDDLIPPADIVTNYSDTIDYFMGLSQVEQAEFCKTKANEELVREVGTFLSENPDVLPSEWQAKLCRDIQQRLSND